MEAGRTKGEPLVAREGGEPDQTVQAYNEAQSTTEAAGDKHIEGSGDGGQQNKNVVLPKDISFLSMFRYADRTDQWLMTLGTIGAIGDGAKLPVALVICSGLTNTFGTTRGPPSDPDHFQKTINTFALRFVYLALASFVVCFLEGACWMRTGERQSARLRYLYLAAILRQDEAFFDKSGANVSDVVNSVSADTLVVQDAISEKAISADVFRTLDPEGDPASDQLARQLVQLQFLNHGFLEFLAQGIVPEILDVEVKIRDGGQTNETLSKLGHCIMNVSLFVSGYLVAFVLVWEVALILIGFSPLLIVPGLLYSRTMTTLARKMQASYSESGTVAEQAISAVRTVYSFVGEKRTLARYSQSLDLTVRLGKRMGLAKGIVIGCVGVNLALWAFISWYGSTLVINKGAQGGKLICAGFAGLTAGLALGDALPDVRYFSEGRAAAARIFAMIERVPEIDADSMTGQVLPRVSGSIELRDVDFVYPSRPDTQIFKGFNLRVPAGMTVALVGSSGSGKSTVVALIERFYDPLSGQVVIDDINIKDLQLKWMRTQIGLVSQEPALFATTIKENILFGKESASAEEVIQAAKFANADSFISMLPKGYDTQVGDKGVQMSGGQKQRIAIARAILKSPPILLLDEATSALDSESEKVVQQALEAAAVGRTTLVVAHRLSTIRAADSIAVVSDGRVVEQGSHTKLLEMDGGAYAALVRLHDRTSETQDNSDDEHKRSSLDYMPAIGPASSFRDSKTHSTSFRIGSGRSFRIGSSSSFRTGSSRSYDLKRQADPWDEALGKAPSYSRLLAMSRPEWKMAVVGCLGSIGFGITQPLYAFFLGSMVSTYYITDHDKLRRDVSRYSLIFTGLAVACFVVNLVQHYKFAAMGELLTKRVRTTMFSKILTFEVAWFDLDKNSSGAVCSRLASEANVVRSLVGDRISLFVQTVTGLLISYVVSLIVAWKLSLVMIVVQPIVILCQYVKKMLLHNMYKLTLEAQESGSKVASEAVIHHRTIAAFSGQNKVLNIFETMAAGSKVEARKRAMITGAGFGLSQMAQYCTWALDFWWGGTLIRQGQISFGDLFKCFFIVMHTARMVADACSMTTDLAKGANSLITVFKVLDRETKINADATDATKLEKVDGHVELTNVEFCYPARPDIVIFKNFNLNVKAGKNVALVGQSGSGKSTIIGLIERFYDPQKGSVMIDGHDIRKLHLQSLRSHIALVGQEPTLFSGTIRENIMYGRDNATEAEMIDACKSANAFQFISAMKEGLNTQTGERGLQLSGGQKQRIAIARAILKNPAILLLDEATSALDAQSERVVQDALDRVMVGRTTIVVAHRLSTIQTCDSIAVIQDGVIVERGKHKELLAKGEGGAYYSLVEIQTKDQES